MTTEYDSIVVGSGIAGLYTALQLAQLSSVALVTKSALEESNTRYAQGGIAAVMFDDDDVDLHIADTLHAGAGLCDPEAVRVLCSEGPARIRELIDIGVAFDRDGAELARGMEAAHSRHRVLHAGGDATGARIETALATAVRDHPRITILEQSFVTDIVIRDGRAAGIELLDGRIIAGHSVVLASGGAGQVYRHTTNPGVATGDGIAAAFRAGAVIGDAEFFQFHPTALAISDVFLISEAVRGEGAVLRNSRGDRFVDELAPRDVVARAIAEAMGTHGDEPVYLDATSLGDEFLAGRFPSIDRACRSHGFDWTVQPIPVTPAAHYWMGGILTDLAGRSTVPGLYACGEVANTGVHGANRLASNSLLEGLVFGARIVEILSSDSGDSSWPMHAEATAVPTVTPNLRAGPPATRDELRRLMWDNVGLVREAAGLRIAIKQLEAWNASEPAIAVREDWEIRNLLTVGRLIASAALLREESRGAHFRSDTPILHSDRQDRSRLVTC